MSSLLQEFTKGLWREIPPFRLVLGLCPILGVTTKAFNGLGMGLAVVFVLTISNMIISMVRNVIPSKVRIACFIVISASLVVIVELCMQAFTYPLYEQLGIFVPLIVVNCIILGRAEAFAAKNPVLPSIMDGLGMGFGFTISLVFIGSIREIFGTGQWFGLQIMPDFFQPMQIMVQAPGAFIALGLTLAAMNWYSRVSCENRGIKYENAQHGCGSCSACDMCKTVERPSI
ncbi:MAG: electron transport complex subunit E [Deltaproteobacteria bacterium]|jgi:electron transport complex protein RnfE|nr:electron transport complex subunit E [Deltaproteobacteria bacterium]